MKKIFLKTAAGLVLSQFFFSGIASAHCPLCTIGAGAVAVGASYFGVKDIATGVFIGAFGIALGLWTAKLINREFIKYQKTVFAIISYFLTIIPISQLIKSYTPIYISWGGSYGSIFNRTYVINSMFIGSLLGAVIIIISPWLNSKIKEKTRLSMPFQNMIIIFILLIIAVTILQLAT